MSPKEDRPTISAADTTVVAAKTTTTTAAECTRVRALPELTKSMETVEVTTTTDLQGLNVEATTMEEAADTIVGESKIGLNN